MHDRVCKKVLIGEDRMILCHEDRLKEVHMTRLIRKSFPELAPPFKKIWKYLVFLVNGPQRHYKVETCYKKYSSRFDRQIAKLEKSNDWERHPFIALQLLREKDGIYCEARSVRL